MVRRDDLTVPHDGDPRLRARVDPHEDLVPPGLPLEDLDSSCDRSPDIPCRDDVWTPDAVRLRRGGDDDPNVLGDLAGEGEAHERDVPGLQLRDEVVVEAEVFRHHAEDLRHRLRKPRWRL